MSHTRRACVVVSLLFVAGCIFSSGNDPVGSNSPGNDLGRDAGVNNQPGDMTASDGFVPETCGDGALQAHETCDPGLPPTSPGACPESCDDGQACTTDMLVGLASACTAVCTIALITECQSGDGCCPGDCDASNDTDCDENAICGDGILVGAEKCDPGIANVADGGCPLIDDCPAPAACQIARVVGSHANCDAECSFLPIMGCNDGDGCCAPGCDSTNDSDCMAMCGNGVRDPGELCDGDCPTLADCDDQNACTDDVLNGSAMTCDAECANTPISACVTGDMCCPAMCTNATDMDCSATCGNGTVDAMETCDNSSPIACPTSCDDGNACTNDTRTGSSGNCNVTCSNTNITSCTNNDGCCPGSCNANNDNDCDPACGNNVVEGDEACDGNCPDSCNDMDACTADGSSGDAASCDLECTNTPITACRMTSDGCCPMGCNNTNDPDCMPQCGNGVREGSETCDGDCPASCNDGNACTVDQRLGSNAMCNVQCAYGQITACNGGDGCCPAGCNSQNDSDCSATCGNGVREGAEKCDGNDCPTQQSCQQMSVCLQLSGSAMACTAECTQIPGCQTCSTNNCNCAAGQVCQGGKCETSTGTQCDDACDGDAYCSVHYPGTTCNETTGQCIECTSRQDCAPEEDCVNNFCELPTDCRDAQVPDVYCQNIEMLPACNLNAGYCWEDCEQDPGVCDPDQACVGGFCGFADYCDDAIDPDYWCNGGSGPYVCVGENPGACLLECAGPSNCDCDPFYEQCKDDATLGRSFCQPGQPTTCFDVCPGQEDAACQEWYADPDWKCDTVQSPDGCSYRPGGGSMDIPAFD